MKIDIAGLIKSAKLGGARRDAQKETCAVFAAALYDVLSEEKIPCEMVTVACGVLRRPAWYHAIVEANGQNYDSMGEFSEEIWRKRAKIHPTVSLTFSYLPDTRGDCYEDEFSELHTFFIGKLKQALIEGHGITAKSDT